jgi:hypothetical protein
MKKHELHLRKAEQEMRVHMARELEVVEHGLQDSLSRRTASLMEQKVTGCFLACNQSHVGLNVGSAGSGSAQTPDGSQSENGSAASDDGRDRKSLPCALLLRGGYIFLDLTRMAGAGDIDLMYTDGVSELRREYRQQLAAQQSRLESALQQKLSALRKQMR